MDEVGNGLIALGGLLLVNIGISAFWAGKLTQKVKDNCRRINKLEGAEQKEV